LITLLGTNYRLGSIAEKEGITDDILEAKDSVTLALGVGDGMSWPVLPPPIFESPSRGVKETRIKA